MHSHTSDPLPSGRRTDFTDVDPKILVEQMYQNVVDGYRGWMSVPGNANVRVIELTDVFTLSVMPGGVRRRRDGEFDEVNGIRLFLPRGEQGHGSLSVEETEDQARHAIEIVVTRAQKIRGERDARMAYAHMQDNPVDLGQWTAGADQAADVAMVAELRAARLGFRGHDFGRVVELGTWVPGLVAGDDRAIRDEADGYRGRYGN